MDVKAHILDEAAVNRALVRIAHEIIERNGGNLLNVVFVGIKSRGIPLAKIIADNILKAEDVVVPVGELDISLYRDDLAEKFLNPVIGQIDIEFDIDGKDVVLIDDVLYTGRTVRAAIDALFTVGRPRSIQLAILVDRGHRELPLRADYVGKNLPTAKSEVVRVKIPPYEDDIAVDLLTK